uniref:Metalloendopeptidase n=1 Tax=Strongyloides stercoralis TaxID=6248 RepID=A0A0K0EJL9_STRER
MHLVIIVFCVFFSINSKTYSDNEVFNNETKFKRSINLVDNTKNSIFELNKSIINNRNKRKIAFHKKLKWGLTIFYHIEEPLNPFMIAGALKIIEKETCFRFIPLKRLYPNVSGLRYKYLGECLSHIGKKQQKQWQLIKIGRMCDFPGGIIHETFHALGFIHEQCRYDRDSYLKINEENIDDSQKYNCEKIDYHQAIDYCQPFDFGSIMHYGSYAYSKNGVKTLIPKHPYYENTIGNIEYPSFIDVKILNMHYCRDICRIKIYCFNDGYQDPNNCNTCKCIEGYSGQDCHKLAKPKRACGKTEIIVGSKTPFLKVRGKKNCVFHLISRKNRIIEIKIIALHMLPNRKLVCSFKNALEVKYWKNKAATGARFCLGLHNIHITSQNNHVLIYYKSTDPRNFVSLYFKESMHTNYFIH